MNDSVFDQFYKIGIIPVIEIDLAIHAVPLAEALFAGGLPVAEITLRTEAGIELIRRIARDVPQVLIGAGTVLIGIMLRRRGMRVRSFLSRLAWWMKLSSGRRKTISHFCLAQ